MRRWSAQQLACALTPKATTPSYVQYRQPPLTIDGEAIGLAEALGFRVRFKLFDYGVISVALTRRSSRFVARADGRGLALQDDPRLDADRESLCRDLIDALRRR